MKIWLRSILLLLFAMSFIASYALSLLPAPEVSKAALETRQVEVEPLPLSVYCAGAFVEVGGESGVEIGLTERINSASIYSAVGDGAVLVAPELSSVDGALVTVAGQEQSTSLLSAIQAQGVSLNRASGLVASYCPQPAFSGWFISGAAALGQETVLLIANPGQRDTQVELEFKLPGGVISEQVSVAAGETKTLPVSSFLFQQPLFALEFKSTAAPVSVAMQQRATAGISSRGVDLQAPSIGPQLQNRIIGLRISSAGFEKPLLRLYNPGDLPTEAIITAFSEENTEVFRVPVTAAGFSETPLDLVDGNYILDIQSAQPLAAGVRNIQLQPALDFAWLTPSRVFTELTMPIPLYQSSLYLANFASTDIAVNLEVTTGSRVEYQSFQIQAMSQLELPVLGDQLKVISAAEFSAALEILDLPGYALINPSENENFGNQISVTVQ